MMIGGYQLKLKDTKTKSLRLEWLIEAMVD